MLCSFQMQSEVIQLCIYVSIHSLFRFFSHTGHRLLSRVPSSIQQVLLDFVVQLLSCVQFFVTPWTAACQAFLISTVTESILKFMCIESVMLSNHRILCHPLLLLPSIFPSIFSNELALHIRGSKYQKFSFSISFSNEYSGLFSFMIDWFDLLAVQGTLKSLLEHHNPKAPVPQKAEHNLVIKPPPPPPASQYSLKSGNLIPPALFLFLKIALAT